MIAVLVGGDDGIENRCFLFDERDDLLGFVGRIDQERFPGRGTDDEVSVVVHGADRHLRDDGAFDCAPLRGRIGGDLTGVGVVDHDGLIRHETQATFE